MYSELESESSINETTNLISLRKTYLEKYIKLNAKFKNFEKQINSNSLLAKEFRLYQKQNIAQEINYPPLQEKITEYNLLLQEYEQLKKAACEDKVLEKNQIIEMEIYTKKATSTTYYYSSFQRLFEAKNKK